MVYLLCDTCSSCTWHGQRVVRADWQLAQVVAEACSCFNGLGCTGVALSAFGRVVSLQPLVFRGACPLLGERWCGTGLSMHATKRATNW